MLRNLLFSGLSGGEMLLLLCVSIFSVLLSLTVHEASHGLTARIMGDKTAESMGRITLNPLQHIDVFGAICLLLFGFGWAKPVPINPWNFKRRKLGMVVSALGGPVANFILAFAAQIGVIALESVVFTSPAQMSYRLASVCHLICSYLVMFNLGLGIFNLIPIPPLDGSKVLNAILPENLYFKIMEYERYGFIALILLINMPVFNSLLYGIEDGILSFYNMIIGLFIG